MQSLNVPIAIETGKPRLAGLLASPGYELELVRSGDTEYAQAFAMSAKQYRKHFGATLAHGYASYFCLYRAGRLQAVCGLKSGTDPLFLDQYLDQSARESAQVAFKTPIAAHELVELGGFAVRKRALALPFMGALAPALLEMGFTHAVATATLPVRRCLRQVGVTTVKLGAADPARLRGGETCWGDYYSMRPAVVAGSIANTVASMEVELTC